MKGILCIKFDLFKIKNTDFWAAYDNSTSLNSSIVIACATSSNANYSGSTHIILKARVTRAISFSRRQRNGSNFIALPARLKWQHVR